MAAPLVVSNNLMEASEYYMETLGNEVREVARPRVGAVGGAALWWVGGRGAGE